MKSALLHQKEEDRLIALKSLNILDSLDEQEFDEITFLASKICHTPIALVSFVDKNRQWFKSRHGLLVSETPRDISFCAHTILQDEVFCIPDAKNDERFFDNPFVQGETHIEFYAGVPIYDPQYNLPIGTLCVIDTKPRELTAEQIESLKSLKNQVQRLLLLRFKMSTLALTEVKLRDINQRQDYILEGAGLGSWDWWFDTNFVRFDQRWCEMLGLKLEETPQELLTWDSRVHPDDKAKAYADIQQYLEGKTKCYENIHRIRHASGEWLWILDRGRISEWDLSGKPKRFTGTHLDMTQYKNNELLSAEIQKIGNIGGWELEVETQDLKWTEQTYRIHELPTSTLINMSMNVEFYAPQERDRVQKFMQDCILGLASSSSFEFIDAKGVRKWVELTGESIKDASGRVKSIRGTIQDVTFKVVAEKEIELNRLKAVQNAKLASLGEMSAGVAHEINNPLAIIDGNLRLIRKHRFDDPMFENKIEIAEQAVQRIAKIVDGLRKFSRTSEVTELKVHPAQEIIQEALVMIEPKSKRFAIEIVTNIKTRGLIACDPMEIEQVVINLINNGMDAIKNLENRWIRINLFEEGLEVVLQVIDSGSGIPSEIETKLFQPFFTTKPVGEGTGIGLSICKGIVDHHKANIRLNREFKNTCFEVRFKKSEALVRSDR